MPRLIPRDLQRNEAIRCLLTHYFADRTFVRGVKWVRTRYRGLHESLEVEVKSFLTLLFQTKPVIFTASPEEAYSEAIIVTENSLLVTGVPDSDHPSNPFGRHKVYTQWEFLEPLPDFLSPEAVQEVALLIGKGSAYIEGQKEEISQPQTGEQFRKVQLTYQQIQSFIESEVVSFATKWRLNAPWAVPVILGEKEAENFAPGPISDASFEEVDFLFSFQRKVSPEPLTIVISPFISFALDRPSILREVSKKISAYQERLKNLGCVEYPSSLPKHAKWWFEHYVCSKTYDDIAQMEAYSWNGALILYAKNVGAAVRRFSQLIGIDPKA